MTEQADLFDVEKLRVAPAPDEPKITAGERLRRRQAAAIAVGMHPLSLVAGRIRLHPEAPRVQGNDGERGHLRCGSCTHRIILGGTASGYPKCHSGGPSARSSRGEATDVRSWWPACREYEPKEPA